MRGWGGREGGRDVKREGNSRAKKEMAGRERNRREMEVRKIKETHTQEGRFFKVLMKRNLLVRVFMNAPIYIISYFIGP